MTLTEELVARCHREVTDAGPDPDATHLDDADYAAMIDETLAVRPDNGPLWLFAYGSLIWKPEVEHSQEKVALARGWHRSFCINMNRWRATKDQPGLMMGMDRGGQCKGVALKLTEADPAEQLDKLFRREMTLKPSTYTPRWLKLTTEDGPLTALGFVINRKGRAYAGMLSDDDVAERLATTCGHWGSAADYLYNVVTNLEQRSIHDRHLWRLQHLVAERIAARG